EPGSDPARLRLARLAPGRPVPLLEPGEARDVRLARALLHREAEPLEAFGHLLQASSLQDVGERRVRFGLPSPRLLPQVAKSAADDGAPRERRLVAGDHVQQARLAGSVATDDPGLVAGAQREREA